MLLFLPIDYVIYDCPQQVPKNQWVYNNRSTWLQASSNDISFIENCAGKKEQDQRNLRSQTCSKNHKSTKS